MNLYTTALPEEGLLHLRGKAIANFLQGQLTCDTRKMTPEKAIAGAFCSAKGRVISDVYVLDLGANHCAIRLKQEVADEVALQLGRYAQFSRIAVDVAPENSVFGLYANASTIPSNYPSLPLEAMSARLYGNSNLICRNPGLWEFFGIDDNAHSASDFSDFVKDNLGDQTCEGSAEHWQAALLRTGFYAIEPADTGKFTPQSLNYDRLGMVSFDKGCYTGQEVVARLHYKGKSKTRIQSFEVAASDSRAASSDGNLSLEDPVSGKAVGEIKRKYSDSTGKLIVAASIGDAHIGTKLQMPVSGVTLTPCLAPDED